MITITRKITRKETLWIPEIHITGGEGSRIAVVCLPVTDQDNNRLDPITTTFSGEDFNTFYENYTSDKYLIDCVLQAHNINEDTSDITDFNN